MSLDTGARLGPFEIVSLVGEGGMGQVYRARDTKLARDVAIKVLPDAFARDAERLARFRREAQALAALNDPHIAQIYHLEETDGRAALVMEFVEGRTLAELIHGRPTDVEESLRYAGEIAAGLETAHERGIVHRDLKPANVKITPDGHAKILDFGLAKAVEGDGSRLREQDPSPSNSPTLTARATEAGVILGTAAYMSPEQARGKTIDKRTDIWAFGAVLFEMLTGRRAFDGETVSDTLASVLRSDPDWSAMPASVPPHVRALLSRCLERDPSRRLRDIGEARLALAGVASPVATGIQGPSSTTSGPIPVASDRRPWPWMAATAVLAVAAAALVPTSSLLRRAEAPPSTESLELAIAAPPGAEFQIGSNLGNVILSPDGARIAFVAATETAATIWVRSLAADDARAISGTEGASNPFWSPDGRHLGFFANGRLRTVDVAGGLPENIADAPSGRGGAWSEDGTIIFTPDGGFAISRVAASGGEVTPLTTLDEARGENAHYWPQFLPGGTRFLYFARSTQVENSGIYLGHIDGSPPVRLVASLSSGILARRPGTDDWYLLWARDTDLLAQAFDIESGALSGDVSTVATGVRVEESQRLVYASASNRGHLAWAIARAAETAFALYGRDGRRIRLLDIPPGALAQPTLSPDGGRLLFTRIERGGGDIFMHDLGSGTTERLTTDPDFDEQPAWVPDGTAVTYLGRERGQPAALRLAIGGGARPVMLVAGDVAAPPLEGPDGRYAIYTVTSPKSAYDIAVRSLAGDNQPTFLVQEPGNDFTLAASTDGRTLLFSQQRGARNFLVVAPVRPAEPVPTLGNLMTAAEGSVIGTLRPDGREVIVLMPDGVVKAVSLARTGDALTVGATSTLFSVPPGTDQITVSPDGNEFVVGELPFAKGQTIRLLTRWDARLGR